MIYCPKKYNREVPDINKQMLALKGELTDKQAQITLAKFLRANIGLSTELMSGIKLAVFQEIILKMWFNRNFSLNVLGRGCSKCLAYLPGTKVLTKDKGLISLPELYPNLDFSCGERWIDIPLTSLFNGDKYCLSSKILLQPNLPCKSIITKNGFSITGSKNHLIKIKQNDRLEWKRLGDLVVNDPAYTYDLGFGSSISPIVSIYDTYANCIDFNIPDGEQYWSNGFINHNSFLAAVYCFLKIIFEPRTKILIAGPTFRTARMIFDTLEKIVKDPKASILAQAFLQEEAKHKNDLLSWNIGEGSIVAIPLNGEKIRGFRCNVLILDEFLLLSKDIINDVLMPFLVAPQNIGERLQIKEIENDLIAAGEMKESERTIHGNTAQMIALSSASYTFENLYTTYQEWLGNIYDDQLMESTYFISQLGYQAIPKEMVEPSVIEEAQAGGLENPSFLREYCARFTDGSDGYFSAKKMIACTIPDGQHPHLQVVGDKSKRYILAMDPSFSGSESSDFFVMSIFELDEEHKDCTLVHTYAVAGGSVKDHINYFYFLVKSFNIVFIITDAADGNFIPSANESHVFSENHLEYKFIDEWDGSMLEEAAYREMLQKAKRQYSMEAKCICIKQFFSSDFIRAANEYLQSSIDYKHIWFGSRIRADGSVFDRVSSAKINLDLTPYETIGAFIDTLDEHIHGVKKECALIEVASSARGNQTFDLPQHLRRSKDINRCRKDRYTALLLGAWATKIYFQLVTTDVQKIEHTFSPIFIQ